MNPRGEATQEDYTMQNSLPVPSERGVSRPSQLATSQSFERLTFLQTGATLARMAGGSSKGAGLSEVRMRVKQNQDGGGLKPRCSEQKRQGAAKYEATNGSTDGRDFKTSAIRLFPA